LHPVDDREEDSWTCSSCCRMTGGLKERAVSSGSQPGREPLASSTGMDAQYSTARRGLTRCGQRHGHAGRPSTGGEIRPRSEVQFRPSRSPRHPLGCLLVVRSLCRTPRLSCPCSPSSITAVGGCHTKLPGRARCARAAGCGSAAAGSGAWQTHGPWPGVGGAWSGMWRAVVGGAVAWPAPTQAPRAPPRNPQQNGVARGPPARRATAREMRRGGAQGRTAGAKQGSAARWRGKEARPGGAAE